MSLRWRQSRQDPSTSAPVTGIMNKQLQKGKHLMTKRWNRSYFRKRCLQLTLCPPHWRTWVFPLQRCLQRCMASACIIQYMATITHQPPSGTNWQCTDIWATVVLPQLAQCRAYNQQVRKIKHSHHLIVLHDGGINDTGTVVYRRLDSIISEKHNMALYSRTFYWMTCRLNYSLIRSSICIHSSLSAFHQPTNHQPCMHNIHLACIVKA